MTTEARTPVPRSASRILLDSATLIKQGAEARIYMLDAHISSPEIYWPPSSSSTPQPPTVDPASGSQAPPLILKHRFPKTYRHPTLDATLTRTRLSFEARSLARCQRAGVVVPRVMWVDEREGVLGMEKVEGWSVREILGGGAEGEIEVEEDDGEEELDRVDAQGGSIGITAASTMGDVVRAVKDKLSFGEPPSETAAEDSEGWAALRHLGVTQEHLMSSIGTSLAKLHGTTLIHGDLTTSNMMVRLTPGKAEPYEVVLIDFGLSLQAQYVEHYAVDLYVLERAFASTHPASEGLFAGVLDAYGRGMGKKWADIERRLKEVRLRGRKRDMTG